MIKKREKIQNVMCVMQKSIIFARNQFKCITIDNK